MTALSEHLPNSVIKIRQPRNLLYQRINYQHSNRAMSKLREIIEQLFLIETAFSGQQHEWLPPYRNGRHAQLRGVQAHL